MPPDLLSFLNKLPTTNATFPLVWKGLAVDTQYNNLKLRFPNLSYSKLIVLAVLLQYLDISIFSNNEINQVANLKLELITCTDSPILISKILSKDKPLFDSNSSRVYSLVNYSQVSTFSRYKEFSTLSTFNYFIIKEIIVNLYNGVY